MTPRIFALPTDSQTPEFHRLKRMKRTKWRLLLSGAWADTPFHQGNATAYISYTRDRKTWALLQSSFPRRIVAVAKTDGKMDLEDIAALMMARVHFEHLSPPLRVDSVDKRGALDFDRFWSRYQEAITARESKKPSPALFSLSMMEESLNTLLQKPDLPPEEEKVLRTLQERTRVPSRKDGTDAS
jgi:hypothetical protein